MRELRRTSAWIGPGSGQGVSPSVQFSSNCWMNLSLCHQFGESVGQTSIVYSCWHFDLVYCWDMFLNTMPFFEKPSFHSSKQWCKQSIWFFVLDFANGFRNNRAGIVIAALMAKISNAELLQNQKKRWVSSVMSLFPTTPDGSLTYNEQFHDRQSQVSCQMLQQKHQTRLQKVKVSEE